MPNKRTHKAFNTHVVVVEDFDYRNDRLTDQVMTRAEEFGSLKGVLPNADDELEVYLDGGQVKIKKGKSYIQGERIHVESPQAVAVNQGENVIIWLQYQEDASAEPGATRLDDQSNPHTVWYIDGYTIGKTNYEDWQNPDDKLDLGQVDYTGEDPVITDRRIYLKLGLLLPDDSVGGDQLQDAAVTTPKLAPQAVTKAKIDNEAVGTAQLESEAVTEAKIGPFAVTEPKILSGSVTEDKISEQAVTEPKVADDAIATKHLQDAAVTGPKIPDDSIATGHLQDKAVTGPKVDDHAIEEGNMAADSHVAVLYASRDVKPAEGDTVFVVNQAPSHPLGDRLYVTENTAAYKAAGTFLYLATAGPIRKLRLNYRFAAIGQGQPALTVYLVAWDYFDPPDICNPDIANEKMLRASNEHQGPDTGDISLELDLTGTPAARRFVWGLVLKETSDAQEPSYIEEITVYGLR